MSHRRFGSRKGQRRPKTEKMVYPTSQDIIFPLKDGGIVSFDTEDSSTHGCHTCGYGKEYYKELSVKLTSGTLSLNSTAGSSDIFSAGQIMVLICRSTDQMKGMTEAQFCSWFLEETRKLNPKISDHFSPTKQ